MHEVLSQAAKHIIIRTHVALWYYVSLFVLHYTNTRDSHLVIYYHDYIIISITMV